MLRLPAHLEPVAAARDISLRAARCAARASSRASRSSRRGSAGGRRRTGSTCRCRAARRGTARAGTRTDRDRSRGRAGRGRRSRPGRRRLVGPAADLDRLLHQPRRGVGQHGPAAQRLLDGRGEVGVAVAARRSRRPAGEHGGSRARRSNAQASSEAVVSWPATSSVISSSRSSCGDIGEPSSWRASSSIESTSSRSRVVVGRGARRSARRSASSASSRRRTNRAHGP